MFFSLLLPLFVYLNLIKIYNFDKLPIFLFICSLLFLPLFRASAIWPNAHLTAVIFLCISNYFYVQAVNKKNFHYKYLNLLFLAFATYTMQTYVVLFAYYLSCYFLSLNTSRFIKLFIFCCLLGLPGLYFITLNQRIADIIITRDLFYTLITNFSIMFLYLSFFFINKKNIILIVDEFVNIKKIEFLILILIFALVVYNVDHSILTAKLKGGGFFYKLSHFIFKNNAIFFISAFFGLLISFLVIKKENKIVYIVIIMNLMALNHQIYQKYFEPLFLIMLLLLFKNFLTSNVIINIKNIIFFYLVLVLYLVVAYINSIYKISYFLVS